jgi:hypothetical protein
MNKSKQKGTAFETLIVKHLQTFWDARIERRTLSGAKDRGDIAGFRPLGAGATYGEFVLECKNQNRLSLGEWVGEMETERANALALAGFVIHKRRGYGAPGAQYVTGTLTDLLSFGRVMYEAGLETNY